MTGTGALIDKRKLAGLILLQLSEGLSESGEHAYQIVVSPSTADYPKRTVTLGESDALQLCAELEAVAVLIRAAVAQRAS